MYHFVEDINDRSDIQSKQIPTGNYANVDVTCEPAPSVMRREGNSPTLGCSACCCRRRSLPLALALFTHPLILGRFHTPPYPHHVSILLLPACVLSFLFSLRCCYSNGEMWEYLRPSERGREGGGGGGCETER